MRLPDDPLPVWLPSEADRAALRAQGRTVRIVGVVIAGGALVAAAVAFLFYVRDRPIIDGGVRVSARVIQVTYGHRRSDRVRVAFVTEDGQLIEASLPVNDTRLR